LAKTEEKIERPEMITKSKLVGLLNGRQKLKDTKHHGLFGLIKI